MGERLTKHDVEKIEKEIKMFRKLVVRKDAIEAVKEARLQGDLSENFEYYAAKKEKNQNESRIRYLERMLKTAVVISEESKEDEVGLNNTVTLYMEDDDGGNLSSGNFDPRQFSERADQYRITDRESDSWT